MTTNKFAQACKTCGGIVPAGKGILSSEWSNQDDEKVWVVRHSDKSVCESVAISEKNESLLDSAWHAIKNYIQAFGDKRNAAEHGNRTIIDKRTGYNHVGWIVTVDDDNTIYLTSKNNLDGQDMSETYTLKDIDDDGFGNSNSDIIDALALINNGQNVNVKPFEVA